MLCIYNVHCTIIYLAHLSLPFHHTETSQLIYIQILLTGLCITQRLALRIIVPETP